MSEEIPEWAIERAITLQTEAGVPQMASYQAGCYHTHAFARYIARHEEPPVDPLLIEARRLVAARYDSSYAAESIAATLAGEDDDSPPIKNCLAALRRGIEIAKEQTK